MTLPKLKAEAGCIREVKSKTINHKLFLGPDFMRKKTKTPIL